MAAVRPLGRADGRRRRCCSSPSAMPWTPRSRRCSACSRRSARCCALRRPENPIGPILLALAILITFSVVAEGLYVARGTAIRHPPLAARVLVALRRAARRSSGSTLVGIVLPLLFPTGRLLSPRWRPCCGPAVACVALSMLGTALGPDAAGLGRRTAASTTRSASAARPGDVLRALARIGEAAFFAPLLAAFAALGVRAAALVGHRAPAAQVDRARARAVARRPARWPRSGEAFGSEPLGNVGWTLVHGGADRRHAASRSAWRSSATGSTTSTWSSGARSSTPR